MALFRCGSGATAIVSGGSATRKTQTTKTYTYKYTTTTEWTICSISNGGWGNVNSRGTSCTCNAGTVTSFSKGGAWGQSTIGSTVLTLGAYAGLYLVQAPIGSQITCKSTVDSSYTSPSVIICAPVALQ